MHYSPVFSIRLSPIHRISLNLIVSLIISHRTRRIIRIHIVIVDNSIRARILVSIRSTVVPSRMCNIISIITRNPHIGLTIAMVSSLPLVLELLMCPIHDEC